MRIILIRINRMLFGGIMHFVINEMLYFTAAGRFCDIVVKT